ncbi:hypothetical protein FG05_35193 [Fusarium graminearum]|nr:hypothetical protein FG05_35193 [Fusarium graminearum]
MTIKVILGAQWGDEGKGKLTDILAPEAQLCARAAGGHNAPMEYPTGARKQTRNSPDKY